MTGGVAVNLTWCLPGEVGGSEEYLVRQLCGWAELDPEATDGFTPTLYVPSGFVDAHPDLAQRFTTVTMPVDGHRRASRVLAEATWLAARARGARLVHHGGGTVPLTSPRPAVVTVHDLQYREYPHYFSPLKRRYLAAVMPRSAKRASVVAVPSRFVRSTVLEAFGVDEDRVVVVPHGVEPDLGAGATCEDELRDRLGLRTAEVIVFPAMTHPHKNHTFLVELMAGPWRDRDVTLVLLGGARMAEPDVVEAIAAAGVGTRIVRPGRVSAADRDGLVKMADALVFPSEYEGFGAPVLEAMALGTPVITSDRASLPEVVGDAGIVLPLDVDAWAGALDTVASERQRLVAAGHARAATYSTKASAAALLAAYERAVA